MSWFSRRFEVQDLDTDFNKINEDIPTLKIVFKNIIAGYNTLPWSLTLFSYVCYEEYPVKKQPSMKGNDGTNYKEAGIDAKIKSNSSSENTEPQEHQVFMKI